MVKAFNQEPIKVTLADIKKARAELKKYIQPTPLIFNQWLSDAFGCELYLKLENMQPIGSFKIRGATYKVSCLSKAERKHGVIAASAGNHAQGVAWGSKKLGVSSLIVMPTNAALIKLQNTKALGAEIVLEGENYDGAYTAAKRISQETGRIFVHAYDDEQVIAGQGTIGLELIDQLPKIDYVIGSVGGGGMMSGISTVFRELKPKTQLIGCQAHGAPSMIQSIKQHKAIRLESAATLADGIAIAQASERVREILADQIDSWVEISEDAIAESVLMLLEKAKLLVEGAGAVPLAALSLLKNKIKNKRVVLIISGGNIDVNVLARIIDMGLIRAGRRLRVNVLISDRPGSLASLTDLIGKQGANILQAIHDRDEPFTKLDQTEVALTLETRGPDHSGALIKALKKNVIRLQIV